MEPLEALPPPLRYIEIPPGFSVTQLAASGPCLLRAVVPSSAVPRAPTSPQAEFGKSVHTLMQLAATGRLGKRGVPLDVGEAFEHLLSESASRLALDGDIRRYPDLRIAFTKREWEKRRHSAINRARELVSGQDTALRVDDGRSQEPLSLARVLERNFRIAAEVPFESTRLRIRGRVDLVVLDSTGRVTISDFKSGSVIDARGEPNEQTVIQLRLYGLAVLDSASGSEVSLRVVSRDGETLVTFDAEAREATTEWLRQRTERLPEGRQLAAEELALPGLQCRRCPVRPVCPVYRNTVWELWKKTDAPFRLPLDTAGMVLSYEINGLGHGSVKMADLAGRVVKIHRLRPRSLFDSESGQMWFFDLASAEGKMQKTGWRHPRNFHEVAAVPTENTAWTLQIFQSPV